MENPAMHRSKIAFLFAVMALLLVSLSVGRGGEPEDATPSPFDAAVAEYEQAIEQWRSRFPAERSDAQKIENYDTWPGWEYVPRFAELGADAERPFAFDALRWVVATSGAVGVSDAGVFDHDEQVMSQLAADYFDHPQIIEVFERCAHDPTPAREKLLRHCIDMAKSRDVRGLACLALSECLQTQAKIAAWYAEPPIEPLAIHMRRRVSPKFDAIDPAFEIYGWPAAHRRSPLPRLIAAMS